jgi:hypothetical protein
MGSKGELDHMHMFLELAKGGKKTQIHLSSTLHGLGS